MNVLFSETTILCYTAAAEKRDQDYTHPSPFLEQEARELLILLISVGVASAVV